MKKVSCKIFSAQFLKNLVVILLIRGSSGSEEEDSQNFPENSTLDVLPDNMNDATPLNQTGGGLTIENYLFVYPDINGTVKCMKICFLILPIYLNI